MLSKYDSAIRRLRKLSANNHKKQTRLKPVPEKWEDFARLVKIRSGAKLVSFNPYPYQIEVSNLIDNNPVTVIAKTRQLGLSELVVSKFIHKALLNGAYLAVVLSKNQSDTINLAKRARKQIESLGEYCHLVTNSLTDLTFSNGGRILFRNSTVDGCRGLDSVSDILFDEAGFIDEIDEIYKSALPSTSMSGDDARIIINSTPNGQAGWYFDKLNNYNPNGSDVLQIAESIRKSEINGFQSWIDSNGWAKVLIHYSVHPIYGSQDNYLEKVRKRTQMTEETIQQEYNLSFVDGEELIFSAQLVNQVCTGSLSKEPRSAVDYFFGVDVSTTGADYFVCIILGEKDNKLFVADYYRKRKESSEMHLFNVGKLIEKWKPKKVGIEVTGGAGQIFLEQLSLNQTKTAIEAIRTTGDSKPAMISRLIMAMEDKTLTLPEQTDFIQELLSFRKKGNKMQAIAGKHDDLVMALAFAVQTSPYSGVKPTIKFTFADDF